MGDSTIESLKKRMQGISDSFIDGWMKLHADYPGILWHYTDARGLLSILHKNRLWFSDAAFLNDAAEMSYAVDLTEKIIGERLIGGGPSLIVKEYLEALLGMLISRRDSSKEFAFTDPAFVCCFCMEGDSLHLWRAYTDRGRGYSIGLYPDYIINKLAPLRLAERAVLNNKLIVTWHHFRPFLCRVIYAENEQRAIIDGLLDSLVQAIEDAPSEFPSGNVNNTHKIIALGRLFKLFYLCLICFKHPTFSEEKEWRLIYAPDFFRSNEDDTVPEAELLYRPSGGYFLPYLEIDVAKETEVEYEGGMVPMRKLVFETIFAGPGLDPRLARASFNAYALRNGYLGYNVGVRPSKVPLRSL